MAVDQFLVSGRKRKLLSGCEATEMDGEDMEGPLPEEIVQKIVAMMPFPSIFKAKGLSKSWRAYFSSISSQSHKEKGLTSLFQKEVGELSSNWATFCPVLISREDIIAYDQASQNWRRLASLSHLPDCMFRKPFYFCLPESYYQIEGALLYVFGRNQFGIYQKEMYVANIGTRSWKQLPPRPREKTSVVVCSKLVSDVSLHSYKVILFSQYIDEDSDFSDPNDFDRYYVQIYDPESDAWTTQVFTVRTGYSCRGNSCAYVDGVLYMVSLGHWPNLLAFDLAEGTLKEITLSFHDDDRMIFRRVDLFVCDANRLLMVTRDVVTPDKMQVLKVDLESLQLLQLSRGPPPPFSGGWISITPVAYANSILFRVNYDTEVLAYNVDEDEWSSCPIPDPVASFDCKSYMWIGSSCQPGLNPFVEF